MPNTPKGFPYPAATDPVAQGAAAIQALAVAVDGYVKRSIRGGVSAAGAAVKGTGFTVARTGLGIYRVTFTTPFAAIPIMVLTSTGAPYTVFLLTNGVLVDHADVQAFGVGGTPAVDVPFDFIAIEP